MKYKKRVEWLKQKQNWFDRLSERDKAERKRHGSIKTR